MSTPLPEGTAAALADCAADLVRAGFIPRDAIIELLAEEAEEELDLDDDADLTSALAPIADRAINDLRAEQATWPETTDCDRLDIAFESLRAEGYFARHHYACCQTCGLFDMAIELDDAAMREQPAAGFVFYHEQDTELAVDGYGLWLTYGSNDPGPDAHLAAGRHIVESLGAHGLDVDWSGDLRQRIRVDLDWRRRWPPRLRDEAPEQVVERILAWRREQGFGDNRPSCSA